MFCLFCHLFIFNLKKNYILPILRKLTMFNYFKTLVFMVLRMFVRKTYTLFSVLETWKVAIKELHAKQVY